MATERARTRGQSIARGFEDNPSGFSPDSVKPSTNKYYNDGERRSILIELGAIFLDE
ncbi:hypothetical protein WUBG_01468 [Wuchereria bancrofti]|uniref:Uncharacterized protein n=1 Tax=Wuchereria bancrofti TaxID=6293 RepID=J9FJV8_WUCBA|nr:hypothetical protein WUBG_01468 [Wuchereria bancrofti]